MSISILLKKQGITAARKAGADAVNTDCPKDYCKNNRAKDNKSPLRVEFIGDGYAEWRCSHCLWSGHVGDKPAIAEAVLPDSPNHDYEGWPAEASAFLSSHGITQDMATRHGIGWADGGRTVKVPYFDGKQVVNWALIRTSDGKSVLENQDKISFWGLHKLENTTEPVVIAQRELDAILLMECGIPSVLAIPAGGNVSARADEFNREPDRFAYLSAASRIAAGWAKVVFALDDTKEALALRQELARRLGPGRCAAGRLTRQTVSQTYRDGVDTLCADINEAKPLPIFGLYSVDDFENQLEMYFEHGMASGATTGWQNVDKLYTVVPGQLTVITGIPNSGKSEWVDALTMNLAMREGWRFAAFSPENGKEAHTTKLIEKRVEQSADPQAVVRMNLDTFRSGARWVNQHYTFIESTEVMPTLDWILEKAKDAALRYGIKGLIIDPWNRIEKKLGDRQSETDYVASCLPQILRFAVNFGVHVWLVVHPKQQQKDHKTGKIPPPSLYDMAGSAHFVNMADNGIVIHRSDSIDDTTEVLVRKVRFKHVGRRGETKLKYDRDTGRYEPLPEEVNAKTKAKSAAYASASRGDDESITVWEVD